MVGITRIARAASAAGLLAVFALCSFGCASLGPRYSTIEVGPLTVEYPAEYTAKPIPAEKGSWMTSTGLSYDRSSTSMVNDEQTVLYTVDIYEGVSFEYALDYAANGLQSAQSGGIDKDEFADKWHTNVFEAVSDLVVQDPVMTEIDGHRAFSREASWKLNGTPAFQITLCIELGEDSIAVVKASFGRYGEAEGTGEDDVEKFEHTCNSIEIEG